MRKSIILTMAFLLLSSVVGCSHQEILGNELIKEQATEFSYEYKIAEYLSSTVEEIVEQTGDDIDENGTQTVFEPNVFYPCIFLKNEPILNMLNLKENMDFSEIMNILGEVPVEQSGDVNQYTDVNTIYKIEYAKNELNYVFCSYDKSGKDFDLYIGLRSNQN